ncbi:serine/threonine-protein kinase [Kribbella sp. VKM Ac-2568]|uniref:serine/threonine-protein kinase n=1 Tax=Kribbella sp. VKM Ac-2568 TaxID=2512219 RepID=UPI001051B9BF|nr:serine/threonine-protein kinase [Kribbella sp. VKM Ac-2568]TCM34564.1 serine/threonine protein kinase [Kribbella sp. VKM Ac-2568]
MVQPSHFGRYAVIRRLGSGGFAAVWLVRDEELDAEVAVKVLAEHWIDDLDVRRRFVEEGRFLRKVESPYVVGVHDIGTTDDDRPFLVLTYADRGTLADRLKAGPLPLTDTVEVIENVSAGLQELHDRGVLHRDVKPENVLFRSTPTGERAMLGDLGLGKSLDAVSRVTMPGGTPAYVAPEQVRGDVLDPRADLYALAAVTYAALAGQPPYGATTLAAVLAVDGPPASLRTIRDDVPAEVDAVVLRGLQQAPERRWPDVRSFAEALRTAALASVPATAGRPSVRPWVAATIAAALLGGAGGYVGWQYGVHHQWVRVEDKQQVLSVELPRGWTRTRAGDGWLPQGSTGSLPGLLVSGNNNDWDKANAKVPGVFAGVLPPGDLPAATSLPGPSGCTVSPEQINNDSTATAKYAGCPAGMTTYERVKQFQGQLVRIQVRAEDDAQAKKVLDSVDYKPRK